MVIRLEREVAALSRHNANLRERLLQDILGNDGGSRTKLAAVSSSNLSRITLIGSNSGRTSSNGACYYIHDQSPTHLRTPDTAPDTRFAETRH